MGFFAPLISAFGALSTATKVQLAVSAVSTAAQYKSAKDARKQALEMNAKARADQDNQFVRMREAADRAGLNLLTVLRNTGGQGFTTPFVQVPSVSKAGAFGNLISRSIDLLGQDYTEKYNEEIRDLEIKQRKADLELMPMRGKLMKAQIDNLTGKTDLYAGYGQFIPVKNGVNIQELDITVAKRLGIKPYDRLTGGDLEEILGELHGNIQAGVGSKTGSEALKPYHDLTNIQTSELPPLASNKADQEFVDSIWNGIEKALPTGILSQKGIFSGKTPAEKWPWNKF